MIRRVSSSVTAFLCRPDDEFKERRWAVSIAALAMAITMIPYLIGAALSHGRQFMWLGYNLDDSCVYLSWMRQSADGSGRALNLFTTDPQRGMAPNPLFWMLGSLSRYTRIPLLAIYHFARLGFGFILLLVAWKLIRLLIASSEARRLGFLFICFSAGLGWLPFWWDGPLPAPIDMWQPEAITFLSLYLSPLFCFAMLLQLSMILLLVMGERTRQMRFAVGAGVCGFVLGLAHTYDVVTLTAVWAAYLVTITIVRFRAGGHASEMVGSWVRSIVAGLMTLPAVAYIAYQLATETVFRERANVPTLTPALSWILLGYGLTMVAAIAGVFAAVRAQPPGDRDNVDSSWTPDGHSLLLLVIWAIATMAVAYIPVSFQRKLLQGEHFPIAILAGVGVAWVRSKARWPMPFHRFALFALLATAILCPTNVMFMARDTRNFALNQAQTKLHRTYIEPGELDALRWVEANTERGTGVQPLPWAGRLQEGDSVRLYTRDSALMCFTPGLIDRPVYCGHWGETPDFGRKLAELTRFGTPKATDAQRIELLRKMRVRFLVFSQKAEADGSQEMTDENDTLMPIFRGRLPLPAYLKLRYSNSAADVYEVSLPPDRNSSTEHAAR